ncbi:MAG: MliC family protein [Hyphomonadaceae bacterium]|nr:MliC family protein [Hyphomonadaceae bacterium]
MRTLLLAACLGLAACATANTEAPTPDAPAGPSIAWRCDNGVSFSIRLTEGGNVEVAAGGRTYRLAGVMAASGARYTDGTVEYWEHGGEAMLNGAAGGPYENCMR